MTSSLQESRTNVTLYKEHKHWAHSNESMTRWEKIALYCIFHLVRRTRLQVCIELFYIYIYTLHKFVTVPLHFGMTPVCYNLAVHLIIY